MMPVKQVTGALTVMAACAGLALVLGQSPPPVSVPENSQKSGTGQTIDFAGYAKDVKPFLNKYCVQCHSEKGSESDIPFDVFNDQESLTKGIPNLQKAVTMLRQRKMPPKNKPQPTEDERKSATTWLETFSSGCDCDDPKTFGPGRMTLRRLNRAEYNNTIRDLLAIDSHPADAFPVDDAGYGFDNIGDVLTIAPILMEKYMTAAEAVMRQAILTDPILPAPTFAWDANVLDGTIPKTPASWSKPAAAGPKYEADKGNGRIFYYNGEIHTEFDFPADGKYFLRVRGYSTGGAGKARSMVQFSVDGVPFGKAVAVSGEQRLAKDFATIAAKAPAGKHTISVALVGGASKEEYDAAINAKLKAAPEAAPDGAESAEANTPPPPPPQPPAKNGAGAAKKGGRGGLPPAAANPTGKPTMGIFRIEVEGPMEPTPDRMPESYRRVMIAMPSATVTKTEAAEKIIGNFATKAFRRPLKDDESKRLVALWKSFDADGDKFEESISWTLATVLASPHFLYHMERDPTPAEGAVRTLDEFELASRLSYFLWSSMPDAELRTLADQGKLRANLDAQVARMLQDPKSHALAENFAGQWLQLRLMDVVNPDAKLFPDFDPSLRAAMTKETQLFFEAMVKEDHGILDFLDADFTFLNERLAKHYGIEGIKGEEFRRVKLDPNGQRGGILTQGAILTVTSYANRTSPVLRGKWVLQNLLDAAPPPPPPNVPELKDAAHAAETLRERLLQHRANAACAVCHEQMDAIGFGLENFDGIGAWRTQDGGAPIDSSGVLPGGTAFKGANELKKIIKGQDEAFCRAFTGKMMTYAVGRGMEKSDRCYIDPIVSNVMRNDYRFSVLVREIVHSDVFQKRSAN